MTVTNSHAEPPERDWKDDFPESPPDFGEGAGFEDAVTPFIRPPETFDSLFTWKAYERGGISFALAGWWRKESPEPGYYYTDTVNGYVGLAPCRIFIEVCNDGDGWQIIYRTASAPPQLGEDQDDSGTQ